MPPIPADVEVAKRVAAELNDITKFMLGNPANASAAYWAPPPYVGFWDWKDPDAWLRHGERCYLLAQENPAGSLRYEEAKLSVKPVPISLIAELRKEYLRDRGLFEKHRWLEQKFPKEARDIMGTAVGEKSKVCAGCKKPVIDKGAEVANPTSSQWTLIDHDPMCLTKRAMVRGKEKDQFVEGGLLYEGKFSTVTKAPSGVLSMEAQQFLANQGASFGQVDMYEFICKFRCNDHAAMAAYLLHERNATMAPFEIIRNGNDSMNCHYYVVIGRKGKSSDTYTTNFLSGREGASPLEALGPDAIILDPWATKHGHKFPAGEELGGVNADLATNNRWLIRPMEFGSTLFPIARFTYNAG